VGVGVGVGTLRENGGWGDESMRDLRSVGFLSALLLLACAGQRPEPVSTTPPGAVAAEARGHEGTSRYEATIRRSSYGVAHIEAADLGSLVDGSRFLTEAGSRKEWRPNRFRPDDVAAGVRREYVVGGGRRDHERVDGVIER
jgi:hypothetical protein